MWQRILVHSYRSPKHSGAGVALNAHQVHPEQAELLLVAAGAAAPPAGAGAAQRTAAGQCSHAGRSRATRTPPQVMILGSLSIYIQRRLSPCKDRPDFLRARVREVVSGICGCVSCGAAIESVRVGSPHSIYYVHVIEAITWDLHVIDYVPGT